MQDHVAGRLARPVSTKHLSFVEISASQARSSWLMRLRWRHSRK
jgi:hypothetical protein